MQLHGRVSVLLAHQQLPFLLQYVMLSYVQRDRVLINNCFNYFPQMRSSGPQSFHVCIIIILWL
jgi:hypothetical protein